MNGKDQIYSKSTSSQFNFHSPTEMKLSRSRIFLNEMKMMSVSVEYEGRDFFLEHS